MDLSGPHFATTVLHALAHFNAWEKLSRETESDGLIISSLVFILCEIPICVIEPSPVNTVLHAAGGVAVFLLSFWSSPRISLAAPFAIFSAVPFMLVLLIWLKIIWQAAMSTSAIKSD